mmetsp:Transcript_17947/g.45489  ORF Transcript_17947/g.45489 Transcript_17947/m.45489 type:complete len:138 (+) Transcript_17947:720-1133(+)
MFRLVAHWLILDSMMEIMTLAPITEPKEIFKKLQRQTALTSTLAVISKGLDHLAKFMHSLEQRQCECLAYVGTAAEMGRLRERKNDPKEAKHCAMCMAALASPKLCSRCKKAAYCSAEHQKQHWKEHKKSCSVVGAI